MCHLASSLCISNLESDDTALPCDYAKAIQSALNQLAIGVRRYGNCFSPSKCNVLLQDWQDPDPTLTLGSERIIVETFVYLGICTRAGGSVSDEIISLVMRNKKTLTKTEKVKTQADYSEANKQVEKAAREGNMRQLYDTTKKIAGKYSKPEKPVKDIEDKTVTEIQEQKDRWVEFFEELLNRPARLNSPDIEGAHTDHPMDVTPPMIEEIRMAGHRTNQV
ncbi:unnamed protein product [Schistosoma margrebowiei]|uniref:Uncharacterized protein n=1 Tax=Schistosoma margrebowiei TaxID=48269 RepID=A0A183MNN5_9TREM|nr:unnamed protein product [Schistosoma margrebowiei]